MSTPGPQAVLLLTGTTGVGKTSVAVEIGRQLEADGRPAAVVDLDWLCWACVGDDYRAYDALAIRNLYSVWPNFASIGVRFLVLARAVLDREPINELALSWPETPVVIVRLLATRETVEDRLRKRDDGETLREHLEESEAVDRALDRAGLEDASVHTDQSPVSEVASRVLVAAGW